MINSTEPQESRFVEVVGKWLMTFSVITALGILIGTFTKIATIPSLAAEPQKDEYVPMPKSASMQAIENSFDEADKAVNQRRMERLFGERNGQKQR